MEYPAIPQGGVHTEPANFLTVIKAHGCIGCVAWVIFFPLGAVALRLLKSPKAWLVHAIIQTFAYIMVIVNTGLGIWITSVSTKVNGYHGKIGLAIFALTFFQPIGGLLHHYLFTKHKRSTVVAQTHIWLGRSLISLAMINGGFGMQFVGNATRSQEIAYGVIAGAIWLGWVSIVVLVNVKGRKPEATGKEQSFEPKSERSPVESRDEGRVRNSQDSDQLFH